MPTKRQPKNLLKVGGDDGDTKADKQSEEAVLDLACRTREVADELGNLLAHLSLRDEADVEERPTKRRRMGTKAAKSVWKGLWKEGDISRLRQTMMELQQDMVLRLATLQRYV